VQQRWPGPDPSCCDDFDPFGLELWLPNRYTDFVSPPFVLTQGGIPLPYGGATATLMYRHRPSDIAPLVTVTTTPSASGSVVLYPTSPLTLPGCVQFTTLKAANELIALREVFFDMVITWSTGLQAPLFGGRLRLFQGVTR
jgi:hypothetical protein